MTVTGVRIGDYAFTTFAPGVAGAEESDRISVLPSGSSFVASTSKGDRADRYLNVSTAIFSARRP